MKGIARIEDTMKGRSAHNVLFTKVVMHMLTTSAVTF